MANQAQLVEWFDGLIPEINNSKGHPEQVLIKFAQDHNLPTTQLEKLGSIYNTAKTLSYLEKNTTKRAGEFKVLDVEEMVKQYEAPMQKKQAFVKVASSNTTIETGFSLPNLVTGYKDQEALNDKIDSKYAQMKSASRAKEANAINKERVEEMILDNQMRLRSNMQKLATFLRMDPETNFEQIHSDLLLKNASIDSTIQEIAKSLKSGYHVTVKTASDKGKDRLIKSSAIHELVEEIHDVKQQLKAAAIIIQDFHTADVEAPKQLTNSDILDKIFKTATQQKADSPKDGFSDKKKDSKTGAGLSSNLIKGITQPLVAIPQFKGIAQDVKSILPSGNSQQKAYDNEMIAFKQQKLISDLMSNDTILSKLDDQEKEIVMDTFQTISTVAPTVASNSAMILPWLRQANEFGGVSPMELKTLLDLESQIQSTKLNSNKLNEQQYAV